ncbi:MAG: DUF4394 domain-containing protein [Labilithrix sp.]
MKLQRAAVLPFLFLALGSAIACGDDDTPANSSGGVVVLPGADSGAIPAKPNDAGSDAGDGGGTSNEAGALEAPKITTSALAPVVGGSAIATITFEATGSTPITWGVTAGALPPGLSLSTDGKLAGVPTLAGDFSFTLSATNAAGTGTANFTIKVTSPPVDAYALTATGLSGFATSFPGGAATPTTITGVASNDVLVSLDRRPQNGFLYALGFNSAASSVQLYALEPDGALATPIGAPSTATPALAGPVFGIDFNPAVDRIRVVTSAGQTFRMNPSTGAFVDSDANGGNGNTPDTALSGGTSTVAMEAGYTNSAPNSTITTLYTIAGNVLYVQNPPNNGVLTAPHPLSNVESVFGFDIPKGVDVSASNAEVASGSAFGLVKLTGSAATQLASINLVNGTTTAVGALPFNGVVGFTLAPPATSHAIIALTATGTSLLRFDEVTPGTTTTVAISGVAAGETLVGIDFRPSTGQLFGLGVNDSSDNGTLYLIDPQTGAASLVSASAGVITLATDAGATIDLPASTAGWGFDFNPTVDRIRVTTATGLNFRINPNTGSAVDGNSNVAGAQPDGAINGAGLGIEGVAYTNGGGATATTEYGLSSANKALHIVNPPNGGKLGPAIPVKVGGTALEFTAVGGFDIPQSVKVATANTAVSDGFGYAALTVTGTTSLYKINLVDGAATMLGAIGSGLSSVGGLTVGR